MADARRNEQWSHTAALLAMTANIHRDRKKRAKPYMPAEFHPLLQQRLPANNKVDVHILKHVFIDNKR